MDRNTTPHPNSPRAQAQRRTPRVFAESRQSRSASSVHIVGSLPRLRGGFRLSDR
jgi:hypothetical protein